MSGNNPLVSICCLSYNHGKFIEEAIRSFWEQDYKNIEILALDDGSKDNSLEVLNKLKEQSPCPMEVFGQENSGNIPKNFNFLIRKAKGKYITIIALDDMLLKDSVSSKIEMMEKDDNMQFVINTKALNYFYDIKKTEEQVLNIDKLENITAQDILDEDFYNIHSYYLQGSVYRKSILEKINYFDEDMIADDLILRTKTAKYILEHTELNFGVLRTSAVKYRRHSSNISKNIALQLKSAAQFYQRYYPNKKRIKPTKNAYRTLLKQHNFKQAWELYKEFSIYRDYTLLIPLWLLGIFLKDILIFFKLAKSKYN